MLRVYSLYEFSLLNLPFCNALGEMVYTKTRHIQRSMGMGPRGVLSTYVTYKGMVMEIELRVQTEKKGVEEGWTTTVSL